MSTNITEKLKSYPILKNAHLRHSTFITHTSDSKNVAWVWVRGVYSNGALCKMSDFSFEKSLTQHQDSIASQLPKSQSPPDLQ